MKIEVLFLAVFLVSVSLVSAEIIITKQPSGTHNLGEKISIPVTLKSLTNFYGSLNMNLICDSQEANFYKNGVSLSAGEEKKVDAELILTKDAMGGIKGSCKIKAMYGVEYALTQDFIISNKVNVAPTIQNFELLPGEEISVKGNAVKESGVAVDGFARLEIFSEKSAITPVISQLGTINKGSFSINVKTQTDMRAGKYNLKLTAYERTALEEITNEGFSWQTILIKQKPVNVEVLIENPSVMPGTFVRARAILHDQTGESIPSPVLINIKDSEEKLKDKVETTAGEYFELQVPSNEAPADFTMIATSEGLSGQASFTVLTKEEVSINLVDGILTIINIGNVPYCDKTALIKIAEQTTSIDLCLKVGEEQKYALSAPDGEYEVEILTEGKENLKETVALTGKAIDIREISGGVSTLARHPFIWIFVIGILGFMVMTIYRKGYKKSLVGTVKTSHHKPKVHSKEESHNKKPTLQNHENKFPLVAEPSVQIDRNSKAEILLSIQGEKQNLPVIALSIKNSGEIESQKGSAKDTIQNIVALVEDNKGLIYKNQNNFFFLFSPSVTKTFKNEMNAIATAQKIQSMISNHNKMFRQKLNAGISMHYGTLICRQDSDSFKFMSMGTLITIGKKLASLSNGEILISDKLREVLPQNVKTEKQASENMTYYRLSEVKDTEEHQKFIRRFLENNKD